MWARGLFRGLLCFRLFSQLGCRRRLRNKRLQPGLERGLVFVAADRARCDFLSIGFSAIPASRFFRFINTSERNVFHPIPEFVEAHELVWVPP